MTESVRIYRLVLIVLLAGSLTLVLQKWVGGLTLYESGKSDARLTLHRAILHNTVPAGYRSWAEVGANGTNIRIAVVYFAEAVHRFTGVDVLQVYRWLDTTALFASFLLLLAYLRQTSPPIYALVGLLYVAAILPLTYFFAYFHPWDRLSLACWIALLILLRAKRLLAFTVLLAISMTIKHDVVLLPALYFLAYVTHNDWKSVAVRTLLLFVLTFGILLSLRILLPGGSEPTDLIVGLQKNWRGFVATLYSYPPLLGFTVPVILALLGFRQADRFSRASVLFAILLLPIFIIRTNFIEIRAEIPMLLLVLPTALIALRRFSATEASDDATRCANARSVKPERSDRHLLRES